MKLKQSTKKLVCFTYFKNYKILKVINNTFIKYYNLSILVKKINTNKWF